ncbi:unnamed protein product [Heligmosomoides polygyrus]|uniref:Peptidase_M13_N domain-containing protein n=1 Tax=Heligmosomoides polygyrus TaxID=6339 RepID=A0A3P7Z2K0_HELPZ|nr:unnamed protein product [Heligmosomoides polygyrus]
MEDKLGISPHPDASTTNKLNNDLKELLVFERGIYRVPLPVDGEGNDKSPPEKRFPLSKVDRALKAVNWTRYLLKVAPGDVHGYIIDDPLVEVPDMKFLKTIDSILSDTPSRVLINYVVLRYVISWSEALDSRYRTALKMVREIPSCELKAVEDANPRTSTCEIAEELKVDHAAIGLNYNFEGKPIRGLLSRAQQETADCLIGKFDATTESSTNMQLNGTLTLQENMAAFEGLKFAFKVNYLL